MCFLLYGLLKRKKKTEDELCLLTVLCMVVSFIFQALMSRYTSSNLLIYRTNLETRKSRSRLSSLASLRIRRARDALISVCCADEDDAMK